MTCNVFKSPPMTLREAKEIIGSSSEWPDFKPPKGMSEKQAEEWTRRERAAWEADHDAPMPDHGPIFLCGDIVVPVCACGVASDFLCDYPMGKGKTCDLPLCDSCRHSVDDDTDLCRIHRLGLRAKAGVETVNPWPPRNR